MDIDFWEQPLPAMRNTLIQHDLTGETMLHDEAAEKVHVLNSTAQFILRSCDGVTTAKSLLEAMRGGFPNVPEATLKHDIEVILADFRNRNIVES